MRLTPEQITEEKKYLREFKEMLWFGEHVLTSAEQDLFDTIEALQAENEQLRAQVEQVRRALRKASARDRANWFECDRCGDMRDVLVAIDKALGGGAFEM